jgi:hypothetical protein
MTATTKTESYINGWNAVVDALEQDKDISGFTAKIVETQKSYSPSNGLYHYAEGAKHAILKYAETGKIPEKENKL